MVPELVEGCQRNHLPPPLLLSSAAGRIRAKGGCRWTLFPPFDKLRDQQKNLVFSHITTLSHYLIVTLSHCPSSLHSSLICALFLINCVNDSHCNSFNRKPEKTATDKNIAISNIHDSEVDCSIQPLAARMIKNKRI